MACDCNKTGRDSSPENCSSICTEGTLIQANPLTHCGKAKNWSSLNRLNNQKSNYDSLPRVTGPKQNDGTSDEATASMCGTRCFTDLPAALVCEVLACLDPKGLGIVSCVSILLHTLATDHQGWKKFYCERWGLPNRPIALNRPLVPGGAPDGKSWKTLFVEREFRSKSFMGRFSVDVLRGHSEDVRTVFLLASANLIFTGGHDSVIRMWDMEEGLLIDKSRPLGCTIRAIAADNGLLVTGGTNAFIHCWRASEGNSYLFHISRNGTNQNAESRLWGHEGPVTCLALDSTRIYSGSWDMTVRVWDRAQMKCVQKFMHADWVWALALHGNTVASTAGRDAYVWDIGSAELTSIISNAHVGNAYCSARTHLPDVLFTGGEDGAIRLLSIYDISDDEDINSAVTWVPHVNPVHSLAFEYPWLASASSDGRISLIDLRKLLAPKGSSKHPFRVKSFGPSAIAPPQRVINLKNWNLTACRTAFHQGNDLQTYSETRGHDFVLNVSFDEIKVAEYEGLVIPGGCAPEFLTIDKRVFNSVRKFSGTQKPIASVYYGRLILAATAVGWNRTCTAYPAVKPVLVAAAARWEEADTMAKCLADGNLFTAAAYDTHPEFISLFVKALGGSVAGLNKSIWFLSGKYFLAGVVDGLNNWVDDLVAIVEKNKLVVSTYCSLMHTVVDLARETGMIHGYGFVGKMDKAVKLIDGMVLTGWKPNAFICSTLLDGYCKEGRTVDATTLFKEMLGKGINPGAITYIIMLDCLFKTWRTAVAKEFLKSLMVVYKLQLPEGVGIYLVIHVSQLKIHCGPKAITSPDLSLVSEEDKLKVEPISAQKVRVLLRDRLVIQRLIQWEFCHLLTLLE